MDYAYGYGVIVLDVVLKDIYSIVNTYIVGHHVTLVMISKQITYNNSKM